MNTTPYECKRMTDDEIRQFVLGVCDGRIFHSGMLNDPSEMEMVFMPLVFWFGGENPPTPEHLRSIGLFWEELSKASLMSLNGMPSFFSMHTMHRLDVERVQPLIVAELARRSSLDVGAGPA